MIFKDQGEGLTKDQAAQNTRQAINSIAGSLNIADSALHHRYEYGLKGFAGKFTGPQVQALRNHPMIDQIAQDYTAYALTANYKPAPSAVFGLVHTFKSALENLFTASSVENWGLSRVGGPHNGFGKRAWVLDTGIDLDHADLNVDLNNAANFVGGVSSADDDHGHGTYVTGILAAKNNDVDITGVSAGAQVVPVKVCGNDGFCEISDMIAGVNHVRNNFQPGEVMNISLGYVIEEEDPFALGLLENTISAAANEGVRTAVAAGNRRVSATTESPARLESSANLWTVSAFKEGDIFAKNFPNYPTAGSNFGNPPIDFSAPGVDVNSLRINGVSAGPGFSSPGGNFTPDATSWATPHVAGLLLAISGAPGTDGTVLFDADTTPDPIAFNGSQLPAPSITGSVHNGTNPKLSWSAVTGADSYDIYRRIELGTWLLYTNTTSTSVIDFSQSSPDMSVLFTIPQDFNNTISYKVRATAAGLADSFDSNIIYFDKDGGEGEPEPIAYPNTPEQVNN